jgi:hypothetical protein
MGPEVVCLDSFSSVWSINSILLHQALLLVDWTRLWYWAFGDEISLDCFHLVIIHNSNNPWLIYMYIYASLLRSETLKVLVRVDIVEIFISFNGRFPFV